VRVRTETVNPFSRRDETINGPTLPDAPITITFLIEEDIVQRTSIE
jgi:hypothetical protein